MTKKSRQELLRIQQETSKRIYPRAKPVEGAEKRLLRKIVGGKSEG